MIILPKKWDKFMKVVSVVGDLFIGICFVGVILVIINLVIISANNQENINVYVLSLTGLATALMAFAIFVQVRNQNIENFLLMRRVSKINKDKQDKSETEEVKE